MKNMDFGWFLQTKRSDSSENIGPWAIDRSRLPSSWQMRPGKNASRQVDPSPMKLCCSHCYQGVAGPKTTCRQMA